MLLAPAIMPSPLIGPRYDIHVIPFDGEWALKCEFWEEPHEYFRTKKEAINRGRDYAIAGAVSLVIHGKNGRIQDVRSYDVRRGVFLLGGAL